MNKLGGKYNLYSTEEKRKVEEEEEQEYFKTEFWLETFDQMTINKIKEPAIYLGKIPPMLTESISRPTHSFFKTIMSIYISQSTYFVRDVVSPSCLTLCRALRRPDIVRFDSMKLYSYCSY